jgi:hypothetical protein
VSGRQAKALRRAARAARIDRRLAYAEWRLMNWRERSSPLAHAVAAKRAAEALIAWKARKDQRLGDDERKPQTGKGQKVSWTRRLVHAVLRRGRR